MSSPGTTAKEGRGWISRREAARYWFEIAGLWALAIAWPVYQRIASGPEALTAVGARRLDLVFAVIVVSLLVPTVIVAFEALVSKFLSGERVRAVHAAVIGVLFALFAWQYLTEHAQPAALRVLLPLLVLAAITFLYLRSEFIRNFIGILGLATPVVIVAFCLRYPISYEVLPHDSPAHAAEIESDTPVVVVIFDELPLASLETDSRSIDSGLFPTFGQISRTGTWYSGTTAVADQTAVALPAIQTGETPTDRPGATPIPPGLPNYPDNLCRFVRDGGYDVVAYEPITDLCARTWGLGTRVKSLVSRGIASGELVPGDIESKVSGGINNIFEKPFTELGADRDDAVAKFIDSMPGTEKSLSLLHIALPHIYWQYMPDGSQYPPTSLVAGDSMMSGIPADATHMLQQMLMQLQFADSELAKVIAQMKADEIWDEALVVVTADHGASFIPGSSRRALSEETYGWVLPIPLFIKYPNQKTGKVVRGSVDSRDITPTIVDVLGGTPPPEIDGQSLAGKSSLPVKKDLDVESYGGPVVVPQAELQKQFAAAVKARNDTFGGEELYALGGHRNLLGVRAGKAQDLTPVDAQLTNPDSFRNVDLDSGRLPSNVQATLTPAEGETPKDLAVAVNGRIVATAEAWDFFGVWMVGVNVPTESFREGDNRVELFSIPAG